MLHYSHMPERERSGMMQKNRTLMMRKRPLPAAFKFAGRDLQILFLLFDEYFAYFTIE
jgi:hypothetical protein